MEYPYEFIDLRLAVREHFDMNVGTQPTYALFYMKKGSFTLDFGSGLETISSGDCVIFPDDVSFVRYIIEPITFVYIKFRKNESSRVSFSIPYGRVKINDSERFRSSIQAYESLIDQTDALSVLCKHHLLADILLQLALESMPHELTPDRLAERSPDKLVRAAVELIRANIAKKLVIDELCRELGTNPSTLNFKFRRELNISVGGFIIAERMRLARRLLTGTTYSLSQIATRCGYENVYYFSRSFSKSEGEPPGRYRKRFL